MSDSERSGGLGAGGWKPPRSASPAGTAGGGAAGPPGGVSGPAGQAPPTGDERRRLVIKGLVALLLLLAIAWVVLLTFQYCNTKAPLQRLPAIPPPAADVFEEPPVYVRSVYGVTTPIGIALTEDGTLYVTETGGDRMTRIFDPAGEPVGAFAPPESDSASRVPVYVAASGDGQIFVSDRLRQTLYIYDSQGELVGQIPSPFEEGWLPLGIDIGPDGSIYVTDVTPGKHRVVVLTPDFELKFSFGKEGTGSDEFSFPNSVAVSKSGMMFVSDSNNGRVQIFDANGQLTGSISRGTAVGDLALPRGLAIDDDNEILFVVDTSDGSVHMYDISDSVPKLMHVFGNEGLPTENMAFPNDVALDGRGHAYIVDRENNRVQVWRY